MNFRAIEMSKSLSRWLDRYSPPAAMKDKPQAIQDEADALLRALMFVAPQTGYMQWLDRVLDRLAMSMKTRAWPTVFEVSQAAKAFGKSTNDESRGEKASLSRDALFLLEDKVLPCARRWLQIPGLAEHGRKTLEYWGEK